MAPPPRSQGNLGPMKFQLNRDNHTRRRPTDAENGHPDIQYIGSNRERIIPGVPIVYAGDGYGTAAAPYDLSHPDEDLLHLRSGNDRNVGVDYRARVTISPYWHGAGQNVFGSRANDAEQLQAMTNHHNGATLCGPRRAAHARALEPRQTDGFHGIHGQQHALRSNDYSHNDGMQGVEYPSYDVMHPSQRIGGHRTIAPRPSASIERPYSHNLTSSRSGYDSQEYLHPQSAYDQQYNSRVNNFGHADHSPTSRGGEGSESGSSQHATDYNQLFHSRRNTAASHGGSMDAAATQTRMVQHRDVEGGSPASYLYGRRLVGRDPQGKYGLERVDSVPYQHGSAAQMVSQAAQSRGIQDQHVPNGTNHSSPASSFRSAQRSLPAVSPQMKLHPATQQGMEERQIRNLANFRSHNPSRTPTWFKSHLPASERGSTRHSLLNLDADGYEIYRGPGINPGVFIRPERQVPHPEEPVSPSALSGIRDVENDDMPYYWEPLDTPGGPQRPRTVVGNPDHRVGYNGTKTEIGGYLQPAPMSGRASMLGPLPGMEWGDANGYGLRSATAF